MKWRDGLPPIHTPVLVWTGYNTYTGAMYNGTEWVDLGFGGTLDVIYWVPMPEVCDELD